MDAIYSILLIMMSVGLSLYMLKYDQVLSKSEQKQIIQEHIIKQGEKKNISAIKISMTFIALFMVAAVILS